MKTNIFLLGIFLAVTLLGSCKKSDPPTYTVKGWIGNGTTSAGVSNQPLELYVETIKKGNGYKRETLANGSTDEHGYFSMNYKETDLTKGVDVHIGSSFFKFDNIPVNQNVERNFYLSSMGKLKISLTTIKPLEDNKDTLFIAYQEYEGNKNMNRIDTITHTINGLYKTVRLKTELTGVNWGRGHKEFILDRTGTGFIYTEHTTNAFLITGDPIVDSVMINY
jgi:hypothetical protein